MSTTTLQSLLQHEIDLLNMRIDKKIMKGKNYHKEAHLHRVLLAKLDRLNERASKRTSLSTLFTL